MSICSFFVLDAAGLLSNGARRRQPCNAQWNWEAATTIFDSEMERYFIRIDRS